MKVADIKSDFLLVLLFVVCLSSCRSKKEKWVQDFCAAFQENTITDSIDWEVFEATVAQAYDTSKYLAIEKGLTLNANRHSFYRINKQRIKGNYGIKYNANSCNYSKDKIESAVSKGIGYLQIPTFPTDPQWSSDELKAKSTQFVEDIYRMIEKEDQGDLRGWVIDLRHNAGGNMWPMLLALRPLLKKGTLGYFIEGDKRTSWRYEGKRIYHGNLDANRRFLSRQINYQLRNKSLPVAILIGDRTSSSGEAVAIALQSIQEMKYFGHSTSGLSTGNKTIKIARGEYLTITASIMASHNKVEYPMGIKIDDEICEEEKLMRTVEGWIQKGARD